MGQRSRVRHAGLFLERWTSAVSPAHNRRVSTTPGLFFLGFRLSTLAQVGSEGWVGNNASRFAARGTGTGLRRRLQKPRAIDRWIIDFLIPPPRQLSFALGDGTRAALHARARRA